MYPEIKSTSHLCGIELHFLCPCRCSFIMNGKMQTITTQDAEGRPSCLLLKTAAAWTHSLNTTVQLQLLYNVRLSERHSGPHTMESIEFRLCASLRCLFVCLSIFSIWLLCKQYNQYNKPTNIYQPPVRPEGRDTTTIHEWEVTQLWLLIQGYLFHLS